MAIIEELSVRARVTNGRIRMQLPGVQIGSQVGFIDPLMQIVGDDVFLYVVDETDVIRFEFVVEDDPMSTLGVWTDRLNIGTIFGRPVTIEDATGIDQQLPMPPGEWNAHYLVREASDAEPSIHRFVIRPSRFAWRSTAEPVGSRAGASRQLGWLTDVLARELAASEATSETGLTNTLVRRLLRALPPARARLAEGDASLLAQVESDIRKSTAEVCATPASDIGAALATELAETVIVVPVAYSTFHLVIPDFEAQEPELINRTGMISSDHPDGLAFISVRHVGDVGIEVAVLENDPGAPAPEWDDAIEVSFLASAPVELAGYEFYEGGAPIPLAEGVTYRLRYSLADSDLVDERDLIYVERHRLEFWPEAWREPAILVQRSKRVGYWVANAVLDALVRELLMATYGKPTDELRVDYLSRGLDELDGMGWGVGADVAEGDWRIDKLTQIVGSREKALGAARLRSSSG